MKEGLERFIKDNHPNILREYQQFLRKDVIPKVGTTVELRKKGHCGRSIGSVVKIREVILTGWNHIVLDSDYGKGLGSGVPIEGWWKEIFIVHEIL